MTATRWYGRRPRSSSRRPAEPSPVMSAIVMSSSSGPGRPGLTAAVYAASEGLQTVVLEETVSGGQAGNSPMIRNYPGFPHGISGHDLTRRACEQAWMFGAHMVFSQAAVGLECRGRRADRATHRRPSDHRQGCHRRDRHFLAAAGRAAPGGAGRLRCFLRRGGERDAGHARPRRLRRGGREFGWPDRAASGDGYARQVTMLVRGDSLARTMSDYLIREIEATAQHHGALAHRGHRRPRRRSPRSAHPVRQGWRAGPSRSRRPRCSC